MGNENGRSVFGMSTPEENVWESYKGEYIIIYSSTGNRTFGGKLIDIKEGVYGILNPFQGADYGEGKLKRKLIDKNSSIFLPGTSIEPTTKSNLEIFCELSNKEENKKEENGEKK